MKLFFMSDIHGSIHYTRKALENFRKENAEYIVILGDELYHGARNPLPLEYSPKEVTELLNAYADKILAIRGNCDSEVDEMVFDFPMMSTYSWILYEGRRLFLTHGHHFDENNLPPLKDGDIFFYGHTHIPVAKRVGNIFIINPGSTTLPKEDNPNSYGVLEGNTFEIKDMEGNTFKSITFDC